MIFKASHLATFLSHGRLAQLSLQLCSVSFRGIILCYGGYATGGHISPRQRRRLGNAPHKLTGARDQASSSSLSTQLDSGYLNFRFQRTHIALGNTVLVVWQDLSTLQCVHVQRYVARRSGRALPGSPIRGVSRAFPTDSSCHPGLVSLVSPTIASGDNGRSQFHEEPNVCADHWSTLIPMATTAI
jgi:hypothetical protein